MNWTAVLKSSLAPTKRCIQTGTFTLVACLPWNHVPVLMETSLSQVVLWHLYRGAGQPCCIDRDIG
ncbi:hypothetical protein M514_13523 [Trichuris suis]|uniref:Uncharacterized protein n=1 Tax=Trichuris suis TaxID=68888 RepID=A0A085LKV2_9BILA|nr:hypothetical protein M513_13523 [Trichuris suis]KFD64601.1 hypothetical protein M514_13523 [Trichuris suis]